MNSAGCVCETPSRSIELTPIAAESSADAVSDDVTDIHIDPDLIDLLPGYLSGSVEDLLRVETLVEQGDFVSVARIGHDLKGSGRAYGFGRVSDLGARLEGAANARQGEDALRTSTKLIAYIDAVEHCLARTAPESQETDR